MLLVVIRLQSVDDVHGPSGGWQGRSNPRRFLLRALFLFAVIFSGFLIEVVNIGLRHLGYGRFVVIDSGDRLGGFRLLYFPLLTPFLSLLFEGAHGGKTGSLDYGGLATVVIDGRGRGRAQSLVSQVARLVVFRVQSSRRWHILVHGVILVDLLIDPVLNLGQIRLLGKLIAHLRSQTVQV